MTFCTLNKYIFGTISTLHPNLRQNVNDENTFDFVIMIEDFRNWIMFAIRLEFSFFSVKVA